MIPVNVAVLSNGFRPYPGKVNAVRSVWFGYVTVAAEYGQDILMMRLNISGLQNRRTFEYEDERDKLENLVFEFLVFHSHIQAKVILCRRGDRLNHLVH
jgi:hypothetical protein